MVQFSKMMSKMSLITMICQILKMLMKVHMKVKPYRIPPEEDDVSSEDPLGDHSLRSVAGDPWISPPRSRCSEPSEQSAQPDEEPDAPVADDGGLIPPSRHQDMVTSNICRM